MNTITLHRTSFLAALSAVALVLVFASSVYADMLTRELQFGMTGNDVAELQTFLAADSTIYPEGLITGYFGNLTRAAVMRYQARFGIAQVGRVGPITLASINISDGIGGSTDESAPIIRSASVMSTSSSVTVSWSTNEVAKGTLYYSRSLILMTEIPGTPARVIVSGSALYVSSDFRTSHSANVQNLQSNTLYYYVLHVEDPSGNVTVTRPATFRTQ